MKKGFTLLELLVVIGIITILVSLATSSYSTAQKKARDARRHSDLKTAQQAMEQCYSVNNFQYPIINNNNGILSMNCPAANSNISFSISDPLNNSTYYYILTTTTQSQYSITTNLETGGNFTINNQQ